MRSFLMTAEHGSLSAAAKRLGLTQPTVGRHVQELERALKVVLFARTPRGLEPTEAGEHLMDAARAMREAADGFERIATGRAEAVAGSVRITASEMVATHLLPHLLRPIRAEHPEIHFEIDATTAIGNLVRRDADIAIRMVRPEQPELIARRVNAMPLGLFAARRYLDERGRPRAFEDLLQHDLVGLDRDDSILRGFAAAGVSLRREDFAVRADDHAVAWAMVEAGLGIGFGPLFLGLARPALERVIPGASVPALEMWLVTHREVVTGRRLRIVADRLGAALSALKLDEALPGLAN
ncbi:MAG TPA: LysR family transcriptional regulator [Methylomirabilota bacterium]|nr:LysR family transcriptional regulator [Methylomirabilota bacterium]